MKLTNFQIKLAWIVGIGSIICLWIAFPFIFKTLLSFYSFPEKFNEFGAFGDIYGSLNTLISSIALCAVAFSTWLQVTSLKETRKANKEQFILAREAHDEQIKESRNAVFSNMFYNLLMHSNNSLNSLSILNKNKIEILNLMSEEFSKLLRDKWIDNLENVDHETVRKALRNFVDRISNGQKSTGLYSSFYNYKTLILYVKKEKEESEREFYFQIIANSLSYTEKKALLWLSINSRDNEYLECLKGTRILDLKLQPLSRDSYEERIKKESMLRFIKHFNIDPTTFKYYQDPDQLNNETQP